jgi:hypothetical protein
MITATDGTITREFSCGAWALMTDASKAPWTVVENTCGRYNIFATPYAAFEIASSVLGVIEEDAPITVTVEGGVVTIGILPATSTQNGYMSSQQFTIVDTYLEPLAVNTTADVISVGSITSIPVVIALSAREFLPGQRLAIVNNDTADYCHVTLTQAPAASDTSLAVTGSTAVELPAGALVIPLGAPSTPRKKYAAVIASNKVDLPTPAYTLPSNTDMIDVIVAGVEYEEGQQYTVDLGANRINFTRTNLNGMRCVVKFLL